MLSYQSDSCCDVGKRFANTEDRATRQRRSLLELRAVKGASNASNVRFRKGRFDENCMRDSDVHSVRGSAGVSFAGTVIFSQEPIFRRVTAARLLPFWEDFTILNQKSCNVFWPNCVCSCGLVVAVYLKAAQQLTGNLAAGYQLLPACSPHRQSRRRLTLLPAVLDGVLLLLDRGPLGVLLRHQ